MIEAKFSLGLPEDARMIRQKVFVEEQGYQHEFVGDDGPLLVLSSLLQQTARSRPAAFSKSIPKPIGSAGLPSSKNIGAKRSAPIVLKFLEVKIKTLGGHKAILHAQLDKKGFYEKCGYSRKR
jgi:hypothetical protein